MMAQKYRNAVIKVRTVLSFALKECIFSMQNWILQLKKYRYGISDIGQRSLSANRKIVHFVFCGVGIVMLTDLSVYLYTS